MKEQILIGETQFAVTLYSESQEVLCHFEPATQCKFLYCFLLRSFVGYIQTTVFSVKRDAAAIYWGELWELALMLQQENYAPSIILAVK